MNSYIDQLRWRREKVLSLRAKGYSIDKIVDTLRAGHPDIRISHGTVFSDLKAIREETNRNLEKYIQQDLPFENKLALTGIQEIINQTWELAETTKDERTKISGLSLAKEAYLIKQSLLGDSDQINRALKAIKQMKESLSAVAIERESQQEHQAQEVVSSQ